jgi:hypothetical protein
MEVLNIMLNPRSLSPHSISDSQSHNQSLPSSPVALRIAEEKLSQDHRQLLGTLKQQTTVTDAMKKEFIMIATEKGFSEEETHDASKLCRKLKQEVVNRCGISGTELSALDDYQAGGYRKLNEALRGGKRVEQAGCADQTKALSSALEKLPKYNGMTYRTVCFKTAEEYNHFVEQLQNGEYTTPQFDSTKSMAGGNVNLVSRGNFRINMNIKAGGFGSDIASVISTFPDRENEVLFPPGTKYSIGNPPPSAAAGSNEMNETVQMEAVGLDKDILETLIKKPTARELFGL